MATVRESIPHEERTAKEPRGSALEPVILSRIEPVNKTIRLLRLSSPDPNHTLRVSGTTRTLEMEKIFTDHGAR